MFNGKGSNPRPTQITKEEKDLRYELIYANKKRKAEIKKRLAILDSAK